MSTEPDLTALTDGAALLDNDGHVWTVAWGGAMVTRPVQGGSVPLPDPPPDAMAPEMHGTQNATVVQYWRDRADQLTAAVLDIDAHATPLGEDGDGFVAVGYAISVGSLHRALGIIGHSAARCSSERPCPSCAGGA